MPRLPDPPNLIKRFDLSDSPSRPTGPLPDSPAHPFRHVPQSSSLNRRQPEPNRTLRSVALLEALKGVIVLCAGFGVLSLMHRDVEQIAVALVTRLHIDPDAHYAGIFIDAAAHTTDTRLWGVAALAVVYSVLRLCEAYGLWFDHRWGLWFGVASGGIYVPVELYELWHKPGPVKVGTLVVNLAVIAYLVLRLRREQHEPGHAAA